MTQGASSPMSARKTILRACAAMLVGVAAASGDHRADAQSWPYVHFESPHVHPLDRTPDGARLLVVNTADHRLEVFDILASAPYLAHAGSVSVGMEPVSVRARQWRGVGRQPRVRLDHRG